MPSCWRAAARRGPNLFRLWRSFRRITAWSVPGRTAADIASGQEAWEDFLKAASSGEAASVRLVNCYTLDDLHRYDPDYYESIKDDYPCCSSAT